MLLSRGIEPGTNQPSCAAIAHAKASTGCIKPEYYINLRNIVVQLVMRYKVLSPVDGGFSWWVIADTQSTIMPNFAIFTAYKDAPGAEREMTELCARLNKVGDWPQPKR